MVGSGKAQRRGQIKVLGVARHIGPTTDMFGRRHDARRRVTRVFEISPQVGLWSMDTAINEGGGGATGGCAMSRTMSRRQPRADSPAAQRAGPPPDEPPGERRSVHPTGYWWCSKQ